MIAQPNRHIDSEVLRELLDDNLSPDQTDQVESHLDSCECCRNELEDLAGQPNWWHETVNVLSDSTLTPSPTTMAKTVDPIDHSNSDCSWSLDASLDWIRPLLDPMPQAALGRIDTYPVDSLIGQGGMGVVLRGTDPELNRPVAIKILSPHLAGVGAARARFMREAQAAAAIVHPSIVPIYSIATTARLPYIVMPCINGGNLQQRIERDGPMPLAEVLRIGLQIAEGLVAAHRHGVIHRDIKPANILIEEGNGRVLISDFGLARALDDATITMSGMIAGTPQYMSPEQARGEAVDQRTDLFSLGSLMYALSIGRAPFRAETPLAVLRKICETSPKPIQEINEQMPDWLDRLIGKLMTIDREERIASADDAVTLIRDALTHVRNPSQQQLPASISYRPVKKRWAGKTLAVGIGIAIFAAPWVSDHLVKRFQSPDVATTESTERDAADKAEPVPDSALTWNAEQLDTELTALNWQLDVLSSQMSSFSDDPASFPSHFTTPLDFPPASQSQGDE